MKEESLEDILYGVLSTGLRPGIDELLSTILHAALARTASDNGGVLAFWGASDRKQPSPFCALQGPILQSTASIVQTRRQELLDRPYLICSETQNAKGLFLIQNSRSAALLPMRDGQLNVGFIQLEHSTRGFYDQGQIARATAIIDRAVPAIFRLLLRERVVRFGEHLDSIGASPALLDLERKIRQAAICSSAPVLFCGERGSGKEIAACALHCWSIRHDETFLPVLSSAFINDLTSDELFGHERYSFTGAVRSRQGKLRAAQKGTVFLDEIGDLNHVVQASLLRTLETGELSRIGSDLPERVDVRFVAATNRDMRSLVAEGKFRDDLYDRLTAFEITVPPLRDRKEDIPLIASHYLLKFCRQIGPEWGFGRKLVCTGCDRSSLAVCAKPAFYEALQGYHWPGNVRELKHLVLRLIATSPCDILDVGYLPKHVLNGSRDALAGGNATARDLSLRTATRRHIETTLDLAKHNQSRAAKLLRLPLSTMRNKMKRLGIEVHKGEGAGV